MLIFTRDFEVSTPDSEKNTPDIEKKRYLSRDAHSVGRRPRRRRPACRGCRWRAGSGGGYGGECRDGRGGWQRLSLPGSIASGGQSAAGDPLSPLRWCASGGTASASGCTSHRPTVVYLSLSRVRKRLGGASASHISVANSPLVFSSGEDSARGWYGCEGAKAPAPYGGAGSCSPPFTSSYQKRGPPSTGSHGRVRGKRCQSVRRCFFPDDGGAGGGEHVKFSR